MTEIHELPCVYNSQGSTLHHCSKTFAIIVLYRRTFYFGFSSVSHDWFMVFLLGLCYIRTMQQGCMGEEARSLHAGCQKTKWGGGQGPPVSYEHMASVSWNLPLNLAPVMPRAGDHSFDIQTFAGHLPKPYIAPGFLYSHRGLPLDFTHSLRFLNEFVLPPSMAACVSSFLSNTCLFFGIKLVTYLVSSVSRFSEK